MTINSDTEVETTTDDAPDIRDALSAAFDSTERGDAPPETPPADAPLPDAPEEKAEKPTGQRTRDDSGRFAKAQQAAEAKAAKAQEAALKSAAERTAAGVVAPADVKPTAVAPAALKAPQSWTPVARETWGKLPPEAQAEIHRREREVATTLQESAGERKYAQSIKQALSPYEAQMRAEGSNPVQAIERLFNTALALRTAPPAHKAKMVADIITGYGVPLDHLVQYLGGAASQGGSQPSNQAPPAYVDPNAIVAQVRQQVMGEFTQQRQVRDTQEAAETLASFEASHEFYEDLREDMADLVDLRTKRNLPVDLEAIYNLAARQHPDISKVFEQREAAARAAKANASTQRSRAAASSIRSSPATAPASSGQNAKDLRGVLEASFDAHSGR